MRKVKILFSALILCLTAALMSSCVSMKTDVTIDPEGGGKTVISVEMQKSTYDQLKEYEDPTVDKLEGEGVRMTEFTKDGVEYCRFTQEKEYDTYSALADGVMEENTLIKQLAITKDEQNQSVTVSGELDFSDTVISYFTEYRIEVKMPGKITSMKGASEGESKQTFVLDFLELKNQSGELSFNVQSEISDPAPVGVIIGVSLAVIFVVAVIGILIAKTKRER